MPFEGGRPSSTSHWHYNIFWEGQIIFTLYDKWNEYFGEEHTEEMACQICVGAVRLCEVIGLFDQCFQGEEISKTPRGYYPPYQPYQHNIFLISNQVKLTFHLSCDGINTLIHPKSCFFFVERVKRNRRIFKSHLWGGLFWHVHPPYLGFPRGGLLQKTRQPLASPGFQELHSLLPWLSLPPHWIQLPAERYIPLTLNTMLTSASFTTTTLSS